MASAKKRLAGYKKKKIIEREPNTETRNAEILLYVSLVENIRKAKNKEQEDKAFNEVSNLLNIRIQRMIRQFQIPGFDINDILAEALYALRYKAIQDYDSTRSYNGEISPFDKFAMLCIRRHLSTKRKSSYQNRNRALNTAMSLNQKRSHGTGAEGDNDLCLEDIQPARTHDILQSISNREYYSIMLAKLMEKLSDFEKHVFRLYCKRFSYEKITEELNQETHDTEVNVKSIDNALMRIKQKARGIAEQHEED